MGNFHLKWMNPVSGGLEKCKVSLLLGQFCHLLYSSYRTTRFSIMKLVLNVEKIKFISKSSTSYDSSIAILALQGNLIALVLEYKYHN